MHESDVAYGELAAEADKRFESRTRYDAEVEAILNWEGNLNHQVTGTINGNAVKDSSNEAVKQGSTSTRLLVRLWRHAFDSIAVSSSSSHTSHKLSSAT